MSISVFILGESGTGKSASMRNLFPTDICLIQAVGKPLPFQPKGWATAARKSEEGKLVKTGEAGNIFITDEAEHICTILERTTKDIIIIDDFQYVMANEFMRGVTVEARVQPNCTQRMAHHQHRQQPARTQARLYPKPHPNRRLRQNKSQNHRQAVGRQNHTGRLIYHRFKDAGRQRTLHLSNPKQRQRHRKKPDGTF